MKKIKIDQYLIYEKGRAYEILVFPFIKHMWVFYDPRELCLRVDGCKEAFAWLKYAFAILANHPEKIVYFPCRQEGIGRYYPETYHLVLCRPELQFKRQLWTRIKKKLDKKHYAGKFVLNYDRKKLDDYYRKGLWTKYSTEEPPKQRKKALPLDIAQYKAYRAHIEEILGDTVFMVYDRVYYYEFHYYTVKDLDKYCSGRDCNIWHPIGWLISDENIRRMYEEAEKKTKEREKCII